MAKPLELPLLSVLQFGPPVHDLPVRVEGEFHGLPVCPMDRLSELNILKIPWRAVRRREALEARLSDGDVGLVHDAVALGRLSIEDVALIVKELANVESEGPWVGPSVEIQMVVLSSQGYVDGDPPPAGGKRHL